MLKKKKNPQNVIAQEIFVIEGHRLIIKIIYLRHSEWIFPLSIALDTIEIKALC